MARTEYMLRGSKFSITYNKFYFEKFGSEKYSGNQVRI